MALIHAVPENPGFHSTVKASLPLTLDVDVLFLAISGSISQSTSWSEVKSDVTVPVRGIGQVGRPTA